MAFRRVDEAKSEALGPFLTSPRDQLLLVPPGGSFDDASAADQPLEWDSRTPKRVSSQESFHVAFDLLLDDPASETIPVVRGHLLRDALGRVLERKGVDMSSVAVFQDGFHSPLSLSCDTWRLAGCHLRVKPAFHQSTGCKMDDVGHHQGSLKSSSSRERLEAQRKGSSRSLKGLFGLSGDDASSSADLMSSASALPSSSAVNVSAQTSTNHDNVQGRIGKTKSQGKLSGLFSNPFKDKEKMEQLTDILNRYSQHGIPKLPFSVFGPGDFEDYCDFNDASSSSNSNEKGGILHLEDLWTRVVDGAQNLSERSWQQQSAIWELLTTEVSYLQKLKVIRDLFMACLCNLQNEKILTEIDVDSLFGNINELLQTNLTLWKKCLLPMLIHSRVTRQPFDPTFMKETFYKFDQLFAPYIKFLITYITYIQHLKEFYQENELFKTYLAWCEAQKDCNRQRLVDLMVKPMERLTKYALLLKVIHKRTDDETQKEQLLEMISCVEAFVSGVNTTMRCRHEQQRLANIISRIECYEPVECKDDEIEKVLKPYLELDLTCPMPGCPPQHSRQMLLEGDLKMKDYASLSKLDVHCFLFTDLLLVCKHVAKKGDRLKVIRQPYLVDRLEVHEISREPSGVLLVYLNEFNVAITAFTLHSNDAKIWLDALRKAQEHYKEAKLSRPEVTFYIRDDEDFEYGSRGYFIACSRSPRGSGGSSLMHSHSGSVELNEPCVSSVSHQSRATSLEMSEKRASSASSDEGSTTEVQRGKCLSSEHTRALTQPLSPRPERRAFFLKSNSGNSTPNTLSVGYPYSSSDSGLKSGTAELSPTSLTIPLSKCLSAGKQSRSMPLVQQQPQSPRTLRRSAPPSSPSFKPPLVKTKNVHQAASSSGGANEKAEQLSPCCCFDFDIPIIQGTASDSSNHSSMEDDGGGGGEFNKHSEHSSNSQCCRRRHILVDRRCHTADSIEIVRGGRESVLQKHLSWHFESQQQQQQSLRTATTTHPLIPPHLYASSNLTSDEHNVCLKPLTHHFHNSIANPAKTCEYSSIRGKKVHKNKSKDAHSPT